MNLYEATQILNTNGCRLVSESTPVQATPDDPYYQFYEDIEDCYYRFRRQYGYDLVTIERRIKRRFGVPEKKIKKRVHSDSHYEYEIAFIVRRGELTGALVFGNHVWDNGRPDRNNWVRGWTETGKIDLNTFRSTEGNPGWHTLQWRPGWDWST